MAQVTNASIYVFGPWWVKPSRPAKQKDHGNIRLEWIRNLITSFWQLQRVLCVYLWLKPFVCNFNWFVSFYLDMHQWSWGGVGVVCIQNTCMTISTHLPLDKMANNLADGILNPIFLNKNVWISINISLKFVPRGPVDNMSALVQVGNGLALNRWQYITWTNVDPVNLCIYAALGEMN